MMIEVAMDPMQPRLLERIIDVGIANFDLNVILQTGSMIGVTFVGIIGGVGCTFFAVLASQSFGADLRSALYGPGAADVSANIDELETGKLITLTNDVTQVQDVVLMLLRIMVRFHDDGRQSGRWPSSLRQLAWVFSSCSSCLSLSAWS